MSCARSISPSSVQHVHDVLQMQLPYLFERALRLTRNEADAEDLVQDTIVLALEYFGRGGEQPRQVTAWCAVVMRNRWSNLMNHNRVGATLAATLPRRDARDSSLLETRATLAQVRKAWGELPPRARGIAEQCLLDEESYEEVSERFGMTTTNVALSIFRTRARLSAAMFEGGRKEGRVRGGRRGRPGAGDESAAVGVMGLK